MKTVVVDFDGVLHSYVSGWCGPRNIPDPPITGALEWLRELVGTPERYGAFGATFDVRIFSSRSRYWGGRRAMKNWLSKWGLEDAYLEEIRFPLRKPPAHILVDDRAFRFEGEFPTVKFIKDFRPYRVKPAPEPFFTQARKLPYPRDVLDLREKQGRGKCCGGCDEWVAPGFALCDKCYKRRQREIADSARQGTPKGGQFECTGGCGRLVGSTFSMCNPCSWRFQLKAFEALKKKREEVWGNMGQDSAQEG